MATMAENVIVAGFETRPPMLEKGMYDSWKSRIILYIRGKENGEMLKDSIDNGPYQLKPEITVKDTYGVTDFRRPQRVEDLVGQDKLRYDSDIKAVNILLLGLPVDIYTLINHYQTAKKIWDRVKELMEGTKMTNVNFDQLYAFLKHNEKDAKEVREMRQRFPKPLALLANTYNPPPSYSSQQIQYQTQPSKFYQPYQHYQSNTQITQQLIQLPPLQSYAPTVVPQPPIFQLDTGFVAPTFLPTDDPIASLNKNVQGRWSQGDAGNAGKNQASGARVVNPVGNTGANQPRVIRCYNCNGEGHIAKQCTAKKRVKDSKWFKDKMLLAQAQEAGVVLNDEQQDFLANNCYDEATTMQSSWQICLMLVPLMMTRLNHVMILTYSLRNDADNYVPPPVQKNDMMLSIMNK
ncbi:putative reverse transcriptase domain-containing protein [Tanacetum coccineum]